MKKKMCLMVLGAAVMLTACAGEKNAEGSNTAPGEDSVATEVTADDAADTAQTQASEENAENAENSEAEAEAENTEEYSDEFKAADLDYVEDMILSTELITVNMPEEFKGKFYAVVDKDQISFYDKATVDEGFPGYVFSIVTSDDNGIYVGGMFTKEGEVISSDGKFYNVSVGHASEVQWDYTKSEEMPESYAALENGIDTIMQSVEGTGDSTFMYKAGTKGEDLYQYQLSRYITAMEEGWDANKLEEEGMSPEFYSLAQAEGEGALDKIGYAYMDISNDGIDELLIGEISDGDEYGIIYDIYTIVDRQAKLVASGSARDRYYALAYGGLANEYSGGAAESGVKVFELNPNSTELLPQYHLKYDAYTDEENPWFISYSSDEEFEPMTEDEYNERLNMMLEQYVKLDYKPLSDLAPIDYSKVDLSKYDTFTKMINDFKPGMGYANEKLGDTDVFLVSTGTFNGENETQNAIDASLFMYDDDGAIVYLGKVESIGTAYPLSIADGNIYSGGHHNVLKSTVKDGKLVTVEAAEEIFDDQGNSTFTYETEAEGSKEVEDDSILSGLFDEYFSAKPVEFAKVTE